MDATNKEIRCLMQRLLELTDRNAARYDRMIELLDSCRATGGTPSSPSTSTGSDVCDGAEVPAPASHNPVAEVRAPASSDSDVTLDADGPAAPTRTTHSTGDPSHDTTESRSATGTTMEPTVHTATVEIVSVLAAPAATDGTPDGQGISGVTLTPATCSTACLSRHPVVAPVLVASLLPVLTESVSQGFSSSVSLVKEALRVYPSASTDFITTAPATCSTYCSAQQPVAALLLVASSTAIRPEYGLDTNNIPMLPLYNGSKFFMLTSGQRIKSKVPRPMPWPSFMGVHIEARPLPWPSFGRVNGYEFLSYAIQKASQWCSSDNSHTESCTVIGFQISDFCAHTNHTPIVWLPCTISGFHLLVMFRSLELKLLSIGPTPEAFVNYAIPDASFWPGYFVTGSQMNLVFTAASRCSHWIVSGVCDGPTVSSLFTFRWYKWVLHPCNSGQHAPSRDSGQQLSGAFQNAAYWPANFVTSGQMQVTKDFTQRKSSGLDTMDRHILELLSSALATICWAYFQLLVHYLNNYQLTILVTAAGHRMLLARYQNGEKNSHMLLLPWVLEQKEPSITFQFQESSSRSDWCRGNQSNSSLSIEKTGLYTAGSIPSLDKLQEPMKLMAMPVSWQYFSHMELRESGNSISICLRLGSELERISVVPFLSTSCYTTIYNLLSKWYVGWEYMNSDVNTCSSCLNDGVIYTPCLCISGQILITLHKPQPPVQSISKELLIREPYGRNCCVAILSLVLHSILSWNGSSISSHVFPLSLCEKPHGTGYLWQGSIHAEVTFWLDYSFARIDKRPQARQSPHAHCSTGLQIINSVMRYLLCQLFLVRVMSWLEKLLLPTSPRPNAYSSITHTMFWGAYLSCLIICKVWRHNHQNTVQMEIGWPPRAQVGFITSKSGMPWLLVLMRIQGRRNIGVYHIYHQDQVCTDHDYQLGFSRDIGGTKKRTLSWDPGGRHMTSLDRYTVLQFPWDPGVAAAAWGQAAFQGGRDVRDPSYTAPWAGTWAIIMGWAYYRGQQLSYKYRRSINGEGIQMDQDGTGSISRPPCFSDSPILASLIPHPC